MMVNSIYFETSNLNGTVVLTEIFFEHELMENYMVNYMVIICFILNTNFHKLPMNYH